MASSEEGSKKKSSKSKKRKEAKPDDISIDMEQRDPYDLNSHVRTQFQEVIGEPDGAHSDACVWINVNKAFDLGRNCCFACLTYVCAIPIVFLWGCNFACITFTHIYSITPCFKVFWINCDCASKFFSTCIHCMFDPFYEAVALMFTKIYVNIRNSSDVFEERTYEGSHMFAVKDRKRMVLPSETRRSHRRDIEVGKVFQREEARQSKRSRQSQISEYDSDEFTDDDHDPEIYENIHQK